MLNSNVFPPFRPCVQNHWWKRRWKKYCYVITILYILPEWNNKLLASEEKKPVRNEGCSLPSAANAIDFLEIISFALTNAFNDMFYQLEHLIIGLHIFKMWCIKRLHRQQNLFESVVVKKKQPNMSVHTVFSYTVTKTFFPVKKISSVLIHTLSWLRCHLQGEGCTIKKKIITDFWSHLLLDF